MHHAPQRVVICTGGFDPPHQGHISYLRAAKALGDHLIVGINSDEWLMRKKNMYLMNIEERIAVVGALRYVDEVIEIDDSDDTGRDAIRRARSKYPDAIIVYANGGDRTAENIPEMDEPGITFAFGVGGDDNANSSSDILRRYAQYLVGRREQESSSFWRMS